MNIGITGYEFQHAGSFSTINCSNLSDELFNMDVFLALFGV